jgi:hypothetical protein
MSAKRGMFDFPFRSNSASTLNSLPPDSGFGMDYTNPAYVPTEEDGDDAASTDDLPPIPKRDYPMDDDTTPTQPHFLPDGPQLPPTGTDPNGPTEPTDPMDPSVHLPPGTEPLFEPPEEEDELYEDMRDPADPPPRSKSPRHHVGFEVDPDSPTPGDEEDDGTKRPLLTEDGFPQE